MNPKLIVFDLDLTLWECGGSWCDCLTPPFKITDGKVVDRNGSHIRLYPDVMSILDECDSQEIAMALASRTDEPEWARELLGLLDISYRFEYSEIYPSSKLAHFSELRRQSGFEFEEMLFFDDEMRNITECSKIGVTCVYVERGLTREVFDDAMNGFGIES